MPSDADLTFDDLLQFSEQDAPPARSNVSRLDTRRAQQARLKSVIVETAPVASSLPVAMPARMPSPAPKPTPAPVPTPVMTTQPVSARSHLNHTAEPAPRVPKPISKKGEFHRPELYTTWQRLTGNLAFTIAGWSLLVVATAVVVTLAVARFAA